MRIFRILTAGFVLFGTALAPLPAVAPAFAAEAASAFVTGKEFESAILRMHPHDSSLAVDYMEMKWKLDRLNGVGGVEVGAKRGQPPEPIETVLAGLNRNLRDYKERADSVVEKKRLAGEDAKAFTDAYYFVRLGIIVLCVKISPYALKKVEGELSSLEAQANLLAANIQALGRRLSPAAKKKLVDRLEALNSEGTRAWNELHQIALNIDDMGRPMDSAPGIALGAGQSTRNFAGELAVSVNPIQSRVAALAIKLHGLDARLNGDRGRDEERVAVAQSAALSVRLRPLLTDPFRSSGGDVERPAMQADASAGALTDAVSAPPNGSKANDLNLSAPRKTLLDVGHVPPAPRALAEVQRSPVFVGTEEKDVAPKETNAVNALRARGETRTIGNPGKRAFLVYAQNGGTCGIAAQVQVWADSQRERPGPDQLRAKEDEFYLRALSLGYVAGVSADPRRRENAGTPIQYLGNLLDRPVRKHYSASDEALLAAALMGRMLIVTVNPEILWNNANFRGVSHTIVITGVEIETVTGRLLGYYINDTGVNEGGRFVAASQFLDAWHGRGHMFVEPL